MALRRGTNSPPLYRRHLRWFPAGPCSAHTVNIGIMDSAYEVWVAATQSGRNSHAPNWTRMPPCPAQRLAPVAGQLQLKGTFSGGVMALTYIGKGREELSLIHPR